MPRAPLRWSPPKHGLCATHVRLVRQHCDGQRASAHARGYDWRWRKARDIYLAQHPLCECEACTRQGRIMVSTVVDHRIPHRGDPVLFWDQSNWCAMAKHCHDAKTAREDGGFGNARGSAVRPALTQG
ncbi:HNH endonuclease [Burkholderia pseudomallei]|uniref:HNH endonuclease n=1 Tax=Burkholderia pseudomallei TaxID=28450 RepID=UPI0009B2410F|nr:HNH endonuclease [Burkholderia pseudomallei]